MRHIHAAVVLDETLFFRHADSLCDILRGDIAVAYDRKNFVRAEGVECMFAASLRRLRRIAVVSAVAAE